jgi:hypothetical protein
MGAVKLPRLLPHITLLRAPHTASATRPTSTTTTHQHVFCIEACLPPPHSPRTPHTHKTRTHTTTMHTVQLAIWLMSTAVEPPSSSLPTRCPSGFVLVDQVLLAAGSSELVRAALRADPYAVPFLQHCAPACSKGFGLVDQVLLEAGSSELVRAALRADPNAAPFLQSCERCSPGMFQALDGVAAPCQPKATCGVDTLYVDSPTVEQSCIECPADAQQPFLSHQNKTCLHDRNACPLGQGMQWQLPQVISMYHQCQGCRKQFSTGLHISCDDSTSENLKRDCGSVGCAFQPR